MSPPLLHRRALVSGGAVALALSACGRSEAPVDEAGRVRLRFATDTRANVDHAGFYMALASGAYARRGLNVQIVQGGPQASGVPGQLAAGAAEIGLAASSFIPMNLIAEGAPVRAVAAFFQKDPQILLAHPDPDLTGVADLEGRPFMASATDRAGVWTWLRARFGFTDGQLMDVENPIASFVADPQAVLIGSLTRTVQAAREAGLEAPRVFLLADEGYPSYGAVVLSPVSFARDNAQALRSFIAASSEGWRDYMVGEGGSVDQRAAEALIVRDNPDMTPALLAQGRAALRSSSAVTGGDAALYGLGAMTEDRWRAFFEAGREAGVYPAGLDWSQAYTNAYLPGRR